MVRHLLGFVVLGGLSMILWMVWTGPNGPLELGVASRSRDAESGRGAAPTTAPPPDALRVLFVGNSHTQYNDMPGMIAKLAAADGVSRPLYAEVEARGGATLEEHLSSGRVADRLRGGRWEYVVLQEQQQRPSFTFNPKQVERQFMGPAQTLDVLIRAAGAGTLLFMTWARRKGDPGNVTGDTYEQMQARLESGYTTLARRIDVPVAPVGLAWQRAARTRPSLSLWAADGNHASKAGSYLAACVLYEALYERSSVGNPYLGGLAEGEAQYLQRSAHEAVDR